MLEIDPKLLLKEAIKAREKAYVPYSNMAVGAALLAKDGKIYTGCNIESASFTPSNCAERTAFFRALYEGQREFDAIAIVGSKVDGPPAWANPCGICRQVMAEFCDPDTFEVILALSPEEYKVFKLKEMFPHAFSPSNLD